jgi:hypothetical protein
MSISNEEIEKRILQALDYVSSDSKINFSQLARDFRVPYQRLRARANGRKSLHQTAAKNFKLTLEQDSAIEAYIKRLDQLNICARPMMVVACANSLLRLANRKSAEGPPPTVNQRWLKRWLQRRPELHIKRQRRLEMDRLLSHDHYDIKDWYDGYWRLRQQHGILDADVWNMDETGFRIGIGKDQWIITYHPKKRHFLASPDDRTSLTMVECVSGAAQVIPPLIILEGSAFLERYFTDLPDEYLVAMSETGYNNDELGYAWAKHFVRYSAQNQKGNVRMLLFDGFDAHCTREFLEVLEDNRVIPYRLPPHSSHLLQPLDVGPFQPYKHWHAEAVDMATRLGCTSFNKVEFLAAVKSIRKKTFTTPSISRGWRLTGLIPYKPSMVLDKIKAENPRHAMRPSTPSRQTPPLLSSSPRLMETPQTLRSLKKNIDNLLGDPAIPDKARKTLIGGLCQATQGAQAVEELVSTQTAEQLRRARQARSRRALKSDMGVLYSQDARKMVSKRVESGMREEMRRMEKRTQVQQRQEKDRKKAWKPIINQLNRFHDSMRRGGKYHYENDYD